MSTKRQQTMAKMARERTVKERRARKLEKQQAAVAERRAAAEGTPLENGRAWPEAPTSEAPAA
jgi:hypothetical protein